MIRRIKKGQEARKNGNPTLQDFVTALSKSAREAISIYTDFTEWQYKYTKTIMDAIEPVLDPKISASWRVVEAFHDALKGESK